MRQRGLNEPVDSIPGLIQGKKAEAMTDDRANGLPEGGILDERKKRIFSLRSLLLLILSIAIIIVLVRSLDMARAAEVISGADPLLILTAFIIYGTSNFFKSLRFRFVLRGVDISLPRLYLITSYHNFFNMILPARTGELTYIYYVNKIGGVDLSRGFHSLIIVRIFDFIVISLFFMGSVFLYYGGSVSRGAVAAGAGVFIISFIILFNIKRIVILTAALFHRIIAQFALEEKKIVKKITGKIDEVTTEFESFKTGSHLPLLALTSIAVWSALYSLFFVTLQAFHVPVSFLKSVIGSTGGVLANVLPINSFGSFGTLEAGWTGGFVMMGIDRDTAIITGFGYHIITLAAAAFFALICTGIYAFLKKNRDSIQ